MKKNGRHFWIEVSSDPFVLDVVWWTQPTLEMVAPECHELIEVIEVKSQKGPFKLKSLKKAKKTKRKDKKK